jgi:glucose-1-phosphate thymidylyltransferase
MKAIVLCGGKGTRLRPLTHTMPKQLVPVANRPVVHYVMDHLQAAAVRDVGVIVAPESRDHIQAALQANPWGFRLQFLVQERPLGLAHTLIVAREFTGSDPFIMYLGDNLVGSGVQPLVNLFTDERADAVVLLKEVSDPKRFGVALLDEADRLLQLVEKPADPPSNLALVGVYVFSAAIHDAVREIAPSWRGELEITDAIQRLLATGRRVLGKRLETWWLDCGKKDDLLEANRTVLDEWAQRRVDGEVDEASRIVGRVAIEEGAQVHRSEVRGPTVIAAGALISDAFIGPYTSIGRGCVVRNSALQHCVMLDGAVVDGAERLEDSVLGRHATVKRDGMQRPLRLMVGDDTEVLL